MASEAAVSSLNSSSMKGNPFDADRHRLTDVLEEAIG